MFNRSPWASCSFANKQTPNTYKIENKNASNAPGLDVNLTYSLNGEVHEEFCILFMQTWSIYNF